MRLITLVYCIIENCQVLLAHPHEWVRLAAAQFLGYIFSSLDPDMVAKTALCGNRQFSKAECRYFYDDTRHKLKSLILDLCAQLHPSDIGPDLVEQVRVKIFHKHIYIYIYIYIDGRKILCRP